MWPVATTSRRSISATSWAAALTGNHTYSRFNPAGGLTYKILPGLTAYASYADANRAPTPAELTCSSAASPCSLANFFVGDPNLQQVVSHTIEAGVAQPVSSPSRVRACPRTLPITAVR